MIKKGCGCQKQPLITIEEPVLPEVNFESIPCPDHTLVRIENHPDEEDLTLVLNGEELVLKFKNKVYNPTLYSGYGRVFLRKNLLGSEGECSGKVNILTQAMFRDENGQPLDNTIFIVLYDYDLDGKFIALPVNSILLFLGGSFKNGTIIMNNTLVLPQALVYDNFLKCSVTGVYKEGQMFYNDKGIRLWDGEKWLNIDFLDSSDWSQAISELTEEVERLTVLLTAAVSRIDTQATQISNLQTQVSNCSPKGHIHNITDVNSLLESLNNKLSQGTVLGTINNVPFILGTNIDVQGGGGGGSYTLPHATSSALGGIKIGHQGTGAVLLDGEDRAYVNIDSSGQTDYTVTSLTRNDNTITLRQANNNTKSVDLPTYTLPNATNSVLGGIKVGHAAQSPNEYAVLLDANNKAYVVVPSGGGGGGSDTYSYVQMIYATVDPDQPYPTLPSPYSQLEPPTGWDTSASNADATKWVWMTQRLITVETGPSYTYGDFATPWLITGPEGVSGKDGKFVEFIYVRSTSPNAALLPDPNNPVLSLGNPAEDGFVPDGWEDHPFGITQEYKYEFVSERVKIEGVWQRFSDAAIWSAYGKNGKDGDGVEYIFYLSPSGADVPSGHAVNDPTLWTSDAGFLNDGYIKTGSAWTDDPQALTVQGAKQFVSVRKKYADPGSETPTWHAYSTPSLWAYYSKDGETRYQELDGTIMRIRDWSSNPQPAYNDGTVTESGVIYLDVVRYTSDASSDPIGSYYRCTRAGTSQRPGPDASDWVLFSPSGSAAFDYLLAGSAYIDNLTSKQVVVTNGASRPVGGMLGSSVDPRTIEGLPSNATNVGNDKGNAIFFAGDYSQSSTNIFTAPFVVTDLGHVKANSAEISGNILANSLSLSLNFIDNLGNLFKNIFALNYGTASVNLNNPDDRSQWILFDGISINITIPNVGTLLFRNGILIGFTPTGSTTTQTKNERKLSSQATALPASDYSIWYTYNVTDNITGYSIGVYKVQTILTGEVAKYLTNVNYMVNNPTNLEILVKIPNADCKSDASTGMTLNINVAANLYEERNCTITRSNTHSDHGTIVYYTFESTSDPVPLPNSLMQND